MTTPTRIAVINRFAPPDRAVTGLAALELAELLQDALPGAQVRLFATTAVYGGKPGSFDKLAVGIERLPAASIGSGNAARLAESLVDGFRLARSATRWADLVISLTDPPLLALWLGILRRLRRKPVRWAEWTMDLYPEAFPAAGLIRPDHPVMQALTRLTALLPPDLYVALGEGQRRAILATRCADRPSLVLPCGIVPKRRALETAPAWRAGERRVVLAYAGNVGEAHCAEALARLVRLGDPAHHAFVLSLYGSKAAAVRRELQELPNVTFVNGLSQEDLQHADVHVAALLPAWSHVCVPSKAVSSVCMERPILFLGEQDSDTWNLAAAAGWCVRVNGRGEADELGLQRALREMRSPSLLRERTAAAANLGDRLRRQKMNAIDALATWCAAPAVATHAMPAFAEAA